MSVINGLQDEDLHTIRKIGWNVAALTGVAVFLITVSMIIG